MIINSMRDFENFLELTGATTNLPQMQERGVSVQACAELGEFAALTYIAHHVREYGKLPRSWEITGYVASFAMMLGIELERRGILNDDVDGHRVGG